MQPTSLLLDRLKQDFTAFRFKKGESFKWSPRYKTIFFNTLESVEDTWSLLHELSHGILNHTTYNDDIELLAKEMEAWHHAHLLLAPRYDIKIDSEYIQDQLDTYREWLHARSRCPKCTQTGLQIKGNCYQCFNCLSLWNVNDARSCALRRYLVQDSA